MYLPRVTKDDIITLIRAHGRDFFSRRVRWLFFFSRETHSIKIRLIHGLCYVDVITPGRSGRYACVVFDGAGLTVERGRVGKHIVSITPPAPEMEEEIRSILHDCANDVR